MNPATLVDLLGQSQFQAGVGWGLVGAVLLVAASRREQPTPLWGLVATAAAMISLWSRADFGWQFPIGLALLLAGGLLVEHDHRIGILIVICGAVAVGLDPVLPDQLWIRLGTMLFVAYGGLAIGAVDEELGHTGIPALMVAGTVFGIWATVPETDLARVLMGVMVAVIFTAWPRARVQVGVAGACTLAAVMAAIIASGGVTRPGAIVGSWATLGLFAAAPVVRARLSHYRWVAFIVHGVAVFLASRVAGLQQGRVAAAAIALPTLAIVAVFIGLLHRADRRQASPVT